MERGQSKRDDIGKFLIVFGFLAPAPIISFFSITAYVWMLLITVAWIFAYDFRNEFVVSENFDKSYLFFSIIVYLSACICSVRMPVIWKSDIITQMIQFTAVLIVYLYFDVYSNINAHIAFIKGVHLSAIVQMIWGYLQLIFGYVGIDINTIVFGNLLHMYNGDATQYTLYGEVKVSAFCWNAGNFAPLMIIGYLLSNNFYLKILFIVISLVSGSRTLMFGMLFCVAIRVLIKLFTNKGVVAKRILIIAVFFCAGIIVFVLKANTILSKVANILSSLNVISNYYTEGSTNTHIMYLLRTFDITSKNDFITNLFGFGPNCSGYAFVKHYNFYSDLGKWTVECDYVNCLWNYGYLGAITYYIWYIKNINECRKRDFNYFVLFGTLLVMGLMYNITFNWVSLFIIFTFILNKKGINIFELSKS